MIKKFFILTAVIIALFLVSGTAGYFISDNLQNFKNLNAEELYQRIISERDYAIEEAIGSGDYRCCINPPCTMCYMEANEWNNFTAGTCACDDLIAQGKEPCPQCKRGLCESCKFKIEENEDPDAEIISFNKLVLIII